MRTVHTIGYEGTHQAAFIHTLLLHGVEHVIDVRDRPISRKPGFSKNVLAAALGAQGICYTHIQSLGDPKPGREAARAGRMDEFRAIYTKHLAGDFATVGIHQAITIARQSSAALMCFERDPETCHRMLVVSRMEALDSFAANHLQVAPVVPGLPHEQYAGACAVG